MNKSSHQARPETPDFSLNSPCPSPDLSHDSPPPPSPFGDENFGAEHEMALETPDDSPSHVSLGVTAQPERSGTPDFGGETPLGESSEKQSTEMASAPKVIPILKAAMRRAPGSRPLRQTAISALGNFNAKNREEEVSSDDVSSSDEQDISSDENEDLYQVWPGLNFFMFPFCKRSLICLEGKSMTPHQGNTNRKRSSQQLPRLRLGPSKGFLS